MILLSVVKYLKIQDLNKLLLNKENGGKHTW